MDTTKSHSTGSHARQSELEQFKLFYEFAAPAKPSKYRSTASKK